MPSCCTTRSKTLGEAGQNCIQIVNSGCTYLHVNHGKHLHLDGLRRALTLREISAQLLRLRVILRPSGIFGAILKRTVPSKTATIKDVARVCGLAPSTVSIALNSSPLSEHLRPETVHRVKQAALRLGYRPHESARSLVMRRSHTIGVVVLDLSDPFCTLILKGIDQTLHTAGYLPIIMDAHNNSDYFTRCVDMMIERRVEGVIVVANWLLDTGPLKELPARHHVPTVVVGRDFHKFQLTSVLVNNEEGALQACQHLFDLGHRNIGFMVGPSRIGDSSKRWSGIQKFATNRGVSVEDSRVRRMPNVIDPIAAFDDGIKLAKDLLASAKDLSALVCFDDISALGAIRALHELGKRVPEDCSVIGFDDVPIAALCSPALTTVRQPMHEMGCMAAEKVLAAMGGNGAQKATLTLLAPEIVVRQSTAQARS